MKGWVTPGLVRSIRIRDKLHKIFKKKKTLSSKIEHLYYNVTLRRLTSKIGMKFYDREFCEVQADTVKTWRMVNSPFRGKEKGDSLSPELIGRAADEINRHFASMGS